jgi:hypothetical protein
MSATLHTLAGRKPNVSAAMEEASFKLAACTLAMHSHQPGSIAASVAEGARDWWFAEVQRLNPGGATVHRLPAPATKGERRRA